MPQTLPKLESMQDILDIREFPVWQDTWIKVLIGIVLALILLPLFWKLGKKILHRKSPEKILNPMEQAMEQLQELVRSDLLEKGKVRPFYFRLSEIFRSFLEEVLNIPSLETTAAELKTLLQENSPWDKKNLEQAFWFIDLSELAKFSQFRPEREEMVKSVKACRTLMEVLWEDQHKTDEVKT